MDRGELQYPGFADGLAVRPKGLTSFKFISKNCCSSPALKRSRVSVVFGARRRREELQ
jgi:hypothetical protein